MAKVKPIKSGEKLTEIQQELYADKTVRGRRMFLLFEVGIYTGLRISDIVRLRVEHLCGNEIQLIEKKTGKETVLPMAVQLRRVIDERCAGMDPGDYLFPSRAKYPDGTHKHISTRQAYNDMKEIAKRFRLGDNIGCHTLRKTFGYQHYRQNHDLEVLRMWFNHSSQNVTRRYICVEAEEMRRSLQGFNMGWTVPEGKRAESQRRRYAGKALDVEYGKTDE